MSNKRENIARFGIATKGLVYLLIGVLATMAALGEGGKKSGSSGVLDYLAKQSFGQILLVIIGVGLIGYVFWRMYQAFADPEENGNDTKAIFLRIGYFISGLVYGALAYVAFSTVAGASSSGGGSRETMISKLLSQSYGQYIVGAIAIVLFIKAVFQLYKAYSGEYKEHVQQSSLRSEAKSLMIKAGKVGFTARGIVIGLIAYFTFKAALTANSDQAGGTKQALNFLQDEFGTIVLMIVALGLAAYGVFMFIKAKYVQTDIN